MTARSWRLAAGAGVAVLVVVGTTVTMSTGDPADAGRAADETSPHQVTPVAPRDQGPGRDHRLTLPVQSYEVLAPDRLRLRYTTGVPECAGRLRQAVVKEDDEEVVVVLVLRPPTAPADQPCPEIALLRDTVVRLAAPLRDRRVVDGSTGRPVHRGHRDLY